MVFAVGGAGQSGAHIFDLLHAVGHTCDVRLNDA